MRTTRPLLEPRSSGLLALLACLSIPGAATLSCSSDDEGEQGPSGNDAATDAGDAGNDGDAGDARGDEGSVDTTPLPIRCEAPPCAVALTTTFRFGDQDEGYCALLGDGTVACWGANTMGQLGTGETNATASAVAVRVPGLVGVTSLSHTCAVDGSGAVWCWGRGPFENDASADWVVSDSPVRIDLPGPAESVAAGTDTRCAQLRDRRLYCWGMSSSILRDSTEGAHHRPPTEVAIPAGAKAFSVGSAAFATYEDGTTLSWGSNPGVGRPTSFTNDSWPSPIPIHRISMIDTIGPEGCAVASGVGWCWGRGPSRGSTRAEDVLRRALPVAVDVPEPITRIATSETTFVTEYNATVEARPRWCATTISGAVYCWGINDSAQAGDGTKNHASTPVRVVGLPAPAAEVKIMPYSTCSILTNGKVYCWGNNNYGQIGAGLPKGAVVTPAEVRLP